jgi:hypothetical protein
MRRWLYIVRFPYWLDTSSRLPHFHFVHCFAPEHESAIAISVGRLLKRYGLPIDGERGLLALNDPTIEKLHEVTES